MLHENECLAMFSCALSTSSESSSKAYPRRPSKRQTRAVMPFRMFFAFFDWPALIPVMAENKLYVKRHK